jgi:hypothetical protein
LPCRKLRRMILHFVQDDMGEVGSPRVQYLYERQNMSMTITEARSQLSAGRILTDGALLSGVQGALILGSLWYNPEIWRDDYPPEIRARAAPISEKARRQRAVVSLPVFASFLGILVRSNLKLKKENGGRLSFAAAFLNAYALFAMFNLFDLVVIDYLVVMRLHPSRLVLPGTEGMERFDTMSYHTGNFLKGLVVGVVPTLLIALFTFGREKRQ